MKNRKIVQFVLYPRLFHSISILYKGVYCLSFKLYHVSPSNTITYAYPFLLPQPDQQSTHERLYEQPSLHFESNFSYQTQSFHIVYEQDLKHLKSQCIFRLQYEYGKEYSTFLSCKLMKKQKKQRSQSNLCTRSITQDKYQTVDTQVVKINQIERMNQHQRLFFHCSQFFSSVSLRLCSFYQGIKTFKNKKQLSNLLQGYDLKKCCPTSIIKLRKQKMAVLQEDRIYCNPIREIKDLTNQIIFSYNQLRNMLEEYGYWRNQILQFRQTVLTESDLNGRRLAPFTMIKLTDLNRGNFIREIQIRKAYGIERQDEALGNILEEKELVRYNIRALREYYCILLFHQPIKIFRDIVQENQEAQEQTREQKFVCFKPTHSQMIRGQLRYRASVDFNRVMAFCPQKIERIPYLLVQGYQKPNILLSRILTLQTLTVFVHGYQGNSFDFQKSKNYLKKYNNNTTVLIIESITPLMDQSIEDLGKRVAEEVIKHTKNSALRYDRINFVGFSLGGLLVRACLADLGNLKNKLGIFVTFSSPHLGISDSENSLVNLGVWYLIKVDKVQNLKQLNFQSVKLHDSVLTKLSQCPHISNFSKVVLVSSKDDGFVPLYSTFLEMQLCRNEIMGLCTNLLSRIKKLERVEVLFNTDHGGTLDKLTGRRGHIQFLDNHYFLQQFFRIYGPCF